MKASISKALINSSSNHDDFVLINNVLKEYGDLKEQIKNLKTYTHKSVSKILVYL